MYIINSGNRGWDTDGKGIVCTCVWVYVCVGVLKSLLFYPSEPKMIRRFKGFIWRTSGEKKGILTSGTLIDLIRIYVR